MTLRGHDVAHQHARRLLLLLAQRVGDVAQRDDAQHLLLGIADHGEGKLPPADGLRKAPGGLGEGDVRMQRQNQHAVQFQKLGNFH